MPNPFENDDDEFIVLLNERGQYSLWPAFLDTPAGWTATGPRGKRQTCLAWIRENWTDMQSVGVVRQAKPE